MASFGGGDPVAVRREDGAARRDLLLARNVPFNETFRLRHDGVVYDLTGFEVAAQVRPRGRRDPLLLLDFADITDGIVLDEAAGLITLHADQLDVADLPLVPAAWELVVTPPGEDPRPVLWGRVRIITGTTEP